MQQQAHRTALRPLGQQMSNSGDEAATPPASTSFRPLEPAQAALFEHCPNPVLVLDEEFRIRYLNSATAAIGMVSPETLVGQNVWERYPALKGSIFHQAYTAVLREQKPQRFEEHRADNDTWRSVYAYPADGGVVAVLEDVTEQRRAERALMESEHAMARAQEVAAIGSWSWYLPDAVELSAESYRILGYDVSTTVPTLSLIEARIADSADRERWTEALRAARAGEGFSITIAVRWPHERTGYLHVLARTSLNAEGVPTYVFGTMQDVTERLRAEENLRRSEKTLRLAQEAADIGSFDRDLRTRQTVWSDQLLRIFGIDPSGFDQTSIGGELRADLVHPDDRAMVTAAYARAVESGEKQAIRHRIVRADGTVRHLLSHAMIVRDAKGDPSRLVGTALDITDQVRAEEERATIEGKIQQAQKLESLGILAGGIAHDFNNLLMGILGNASIAQMDADPLSETRHNLREIEESALRAAELTRQLLAYAGKGRFVVETVDVSEVLRDMTELLRTAVSRNTSMFVGTPLDVPHIDVDTRQLQQVMMSLVTNGSDALGDAAGLVSIEVGYRDLDAAYLATCAPGMPATPGRFTFVEVRDTGSGMSAETMQRIFDPFFTTKFTGRGLGLAATLGIMRSHHGTIHVKSVLGEGTTFRAYFPVSQRRTASVPAGPAVEPRSMGRALVVDDEPSIRAVTRSLLERQGFVVDEAENGEHALRIFTASPHDFALVLLDLTMPGMDGEETFRALRAVHADVRVLLMSGYHEREVTQRFLDSGLAGFLQKPFRAEQFFHMVARTVRREDEIQGLLTRAQ